MEKKTFLIRLVFIFIFVVVAFLLFIYVVLTLDPFGWGRTSSSKFSWERFATIKPGYRIDDVIDRLGPPIRPAEAITNLSSNRDDPCQKGGCKKYLFAGGDWGPTFKEAIVIVSPKGEVIYAFSRQE